MGRVDERGQGERARPSAANTRGESRRTLRHSYCRTLQRRHVPVPQILAARRPPYPAHRNGRPRVRTVRDVPAHHRQRSRQDPMTTAVMRAAGITTLSGAVQPLALPRPARSGAMSYSSTSRPPASATATTSCAPGLGPVAWTFHTRWASRPQARSPQPAPMSLVSPSATPR